MSTTPKKGNAKGRRSLKSRANLNELLRDLNRNEQKKMSRETRDYLLAKFRKISNDSEKPGTGSEQISPSKIEEYIENIENETEAIVRHLFLCKICETILNDPQSEICEKCFDTYFTDEF